jgi:saccharopine dehydrogenase-like NADP-dependent oxidoreductase
MKNVIILGASGNIAKQVIDLLVKQDDFHLTLFLRNKSRLSSEDVTQCRIVEGSVIAQKSLATLIAKIIESPEKFVQENLGVNKPNS